VSTWRSYLCQDFLLPAFSPNNETECLNLNSPFGPTQPIPDYFSLAWNDANDNHFAPTPSTPLPTAFNKAQPQQWSQSPPQPVQQSGQSSACCTRPYYYNTSNSKSLLVGLPYGQGSGTRPRNCRTSCRRPHDRCQARPIPLTHRQLVGARHGPPIVQARAEASGILPRL
jgi:hypothetical protein